MSITFTKKFEENFFSFDVGPFLVSISSYLKNTDKFSWFWCRPLSSEHKFIKKTQMEFSWFCCRPLSNFMIGPFSPNKIFCWFWCDTCFLLLLPSVGVLFDDTELELELCIALGVRVEVTFFFVAKSIKKCETFGTNSSDHRANLVCRQNITWNKTK